MSRLKSYFKRQRTVGQSLVELAFFFPILLIILSGVVEFGFAFNQYINLIEATREGARYAVNGDPCNKGGTHPDLVFNYGKTNCHQDTAHQKSRYEDWYPDGYGGRPIVVPGSKKVVYVAELQDSNGMEITNLPAAPGTAINDKWDVSSGKLGQDGLPDPACSGNKDYYESVACIILDAVSPVVLDPAKDDILISVYRVYSDTRTNTTYLLNQPWPNVDGDTLGTGFGGPNRGAAIDPAVNDYPGLWRLWGNGNGQYSGGTRFSLTEIGNYFNTYTAQHGQSAGMVVVELWHHYTWVLGLPWITIIAPNGLDFYTYTIEPVPAAEPKPTFTNTPTPSKTSTPTNTYTPTPQYTPTPTLYTPTPTSTETWTPTPTETETPTLTPTLTPTPLCGGTPRPDVNLSNATTTRSPVWANGWMGSSQIVVTLMDACGNLLTGYDPARFRITAIRNGAISTVDRMTWVGDVNGVGQYAWNVDSLVVGIATFNIEIQVPFGDPPTSLQWLPLMQHPVVQFVCINGVGGVGFNAQSIQFAYSNPVELGTIRRVISLTLQFQPDVHATGPFTVTNIAWGSTGNIIWAGPKAISASSPLVIGPNGWNGPGTGGRSIVQGVSNKPMQFSLSYGLANSGTYTLVTTWDDGNGNNVCTSAAAVYP